VGGNVPFARAYILPPPVHEAVGALPQFSLIEARRERGPAPLYTLQIGVYDSENAQEARRAAEEAVASLRKQGSPAYYHHGPHRSMVTLGLFGRAEFDAESGVMSPGLAKLMEEHPEHFVNGRTQLLGGKPVRTAVVEVPK
jgi:hypothetical protein